MSESHNPYSRRHFSKETEQRLEEMRQILREAEPTLPQSALQRLDAEAIEDRRAFKRRFGCDWPLRFHREALVQLRRERDWTDGEVKLFLLSGTLGRSPFGVRPEASVGMAVFGGVLAVVMLLFAAAALFLVTRSASLSIEFVARGSAVTFVALTLAWLAYQFYVLPWRIQRSAPAAPPQGASAN